MHSLTMHLSYNSATAPKRCHARGIPIPGEPFPPVQVWVDRSGEIAEVATESL